MAPKKVLVTGAYGLIAGAVYQSLSAQSDSYDIFALARRKVPSERAPRGRVLEIPDEKFHLADTTDLAAVDKAVAGMDVIIHLAADPRPEAGWDSVLSSNIIGTRNLFDAATRAGVSRVLYASSIMVSWGYQLDEPYKAIAEARFQDVDISEVPTVTHEWPTRPTGLYPASKMWGEALARYHSDVHGLSAICLRIGWVNAEDHPGKTESGSIWCSQRDVVQLIEKSMNAPERVRFDIFYGVSNNKWRWVDVDHSRQVLGYIPQDSSEDRLSNA